MIVVSNASPICYLVLIGEVELLPKLFGGVHVPRLVIDELRDSRAPETVRRWTEVLPTWVSMDELSMREDRGLENLDAGERAAILLSESLGASLILLDEKSARRVATERGLRVAGLLGVLVEASSRGFVDLPDAIQRLTRTGFRCTPALLKAVLERYRR